MYYLTSILLIIVCSFTVFSQTVSNCNPSNSTTVLDVNNVKATIMHAGNLWSDDLIDPGYEVPKIYPPGSATPAHSIFAGALWIGGLDQGGQLRLAAQTYRQTGNDFWPGPLNSNGETDNTTCNRFDKHWKVTYADVQQFQSAINSNGVPLAQNLIPPSILYWPAKGNTTLDANASSMTITDNLAPFVDVDNDGVYVPENGDYPDLKGDQHIFWVFNDMGNNHSESGADPMGIQVMAEAYAFQSGNVLNDVTFYRYTITNFSSMTFDSVYLGLWADGDLGCFDNDYVGCDTSRDLGITYNGTATDFSCSSQGYDNSPPLLGIKLLRGPIADWGNNIDDDRDGIIDEGIDNIDNDGDNEIDEFDERERVRMSSFVNYNNDFSSTGNPTNNWEFYNYLQGRWPDGSPITYGNNGRGGTQPFPYMYPGDPSNSSEWSECSISATPGDRRMLLGVGPFIFVPGVIYTIDFAVIWVRPNSFFCDDFGLLTQASDQVQAFYDTTINKSQGSVTSISMFENHDIRIIPNPFNNYVKIQLENQLLRDVKIEIFDNSGKLIFAKENISLNGSNYKLSTYELEPGIYHIRLSNKQEIFTKKLVKIDH